MSTVGWIVLAVLVVPIAGLLLWLVLAESMVRVPSGSLGLLMIKGRATDTTLLPGPHFVPALRRRMVVEYPSVEFAYRAGGGTAPDSRLERSGPPLQVTLGDRAAVSVPLTVRFQLRPEQLRLVHERFGPDGLFGFVRDESGRAAAAALGDPAIGIGSLLGTGRAALQDLVADAVGAALRDNGFSVTAVVLGAADLGRTGEVIQAIVRADYEREREQADATTRLGRAVNDAHLATHLSLKGDEVWRYREADLWRELLHGSKSLQVLLRAAAARGLTEPDSGAPAQDAVPAPPAIDTPSSVRES